MIRIKEWTIGNLKIEIVHETGRKGHKARWEFRVNDEIRMYGEGTPRHAHQAVFTRRKLPYA